MATRPPVVVKIRTKIEDIERRNAKRTPPLPFDEGWTPPSLSGVAGLTVRGNKLASLIGPRIVTATLSQSLDEPLTLKIQVWDKERALLTSGLLDVKLRIALDSQGFAMTRVAKEGDLITLEFEDAKVNAFRQLATPIKVTRGSTTRIEFVQRLLDEKGAPSLRRYIDAGKAGQVTVEKNPLSLSPVAQRKPGPFQKTTVKGKQATDDQLDNIKVVLGDLLSLGATRDELVMTTMCVTQESTWTNLAGGDGSSVGLFQQTPEGGYNFDRQNRKLAAEAFFTRLKKAEANAPGLEKTLLIAAVQRPRADLNRAYAQWEAEASKTVSAWDHAFGGSQSVVATKQYEFRRGNIDGSPEDSWQCFGRLADEVQYRRFIIESVFYFLPDELLVGTGPRLLLTEKSQGMLTPIDFDFDEGVDPQSCSFTIRSGDWSCPVGACIELDDLGPGNGVWLVNKIDGDLLQPHIQDIELIRPRAVLTEPPDDETLDPTTMSGGGRAAGDTIDESTGIPDDALAALSPTQIFIVQEAQSWLGVPYVYGGNSHSGIDCSGLTQQVYGAAGIIIPRKSEDQYRAQTISKDVAALKAGDQLFFNWPTENPPGHTGIYIGGGKFIHAPHTGTNVQVQDLQAYFDIGAQWYGWARSWS